MSNKSRLSFYFASAMLIFGGCGPPRVKPKPVCPGKKTVAESLYILRSYAGETKPLRATGQCLAKFYADGKPRKENFLVRLWFNPPAQVRLQGDIAFNPKGLVLGSNEDEFWLAMKPKEIGNSFFWGRWSDGVCLSELKISPKVLLEAFGIIGADDEGSWSLSNEGAFDILTKRTDEGVIIKRVHIYCCDYRVSKIEYFGGHERAVVVVELDGYKEIDKGVLAPGMIKIISFSDDGTEDSFKITLRSMKLGSFNDKQLHALFTRPDEPRGFKHIFRIIDGRMIEQQQ